MTQVLSCESYHGISAGQAVLNMPDGRSVFKLYLLSIIDRDEPVLYDWASSRFSMSEFKVLFCERGYEGVGGNDRHLARCCNNPDNVCHRHRKARHLPRERCVRDRHRTRVRSRRAVRVQIIDS